MLAPSLQPSPLGRAPSAFGTFANNCRLRLARGLRDRAVALARLHPPSRPWESSLATPERGHGDVSLLLLDAGVADHPGPTLRLFLLELRHVRRAAATGQKM